MPAKLAGDQTTGATANKARRAGVSRPMQCGVK